MGLSKNNLKYVRSLRLKKNRDRYQQFIAEGDKIVMDLIKQQYKGFHQIIATSEWLEKNPARMSEHFNDITIVSNREFNQVSALESPTGVLAVLNIPEFVSGETYTPAGISLVLENIQDPGNLGTIIRTASWFGVCMIYCSPDCADCFNPKTVQSSMGAVLYTRVSYTSLPDLLKEYADRPDFAIYGTFMSGTTVWEEKPNRNALIVFGNESRGISEELLPYIKVRLHIPSYNQINGKTMAGQAESLNVASAAAIVCAAFSKPA